MHPPGASGVIRVAVGPVERLAIYGVVAGGCAVSARWMGRGRRIDRREVVAGWVWLRSIQLVDQALGSGQAAYRVRSRGGEMPQMAGAPVVAAVTAAAAGQKKISRQSNLTATCRSISGSIPLKIQMRIPL